MRLEYRRIIVDGLRRLAGRIDSGRHNLPLYVGVDKLLYGTSGVSDEMRVQAQKAEARRR